VTVPGRLTARMRAAISASAGRARGSSAELARHENFAELKRDRDHWPDLESVRRSQRVSGHQ